MKMVRKHHLRLLRIQSFGVFAFEILHMKGVVYVGISKDRGTLKQRRYSHERNGYRGKMFYCKVQNMAKAEDICLQSRCPRHNTQLLSNAPLSPGYIYLIKGRRV